MSASLLAPRACAPHLPFGRTAPDACERRLTCAGEAPASASSASPLTASLITPKTLPESASAESARACKCPFPSLRVPSLRL